MYGKQYGQPEKRAAHGNYGKCDVNGILAMMSTVHYVHYNVQPTTYSRDGKKAENKRNCKHRAPSHCRAKFYFAI